METKENKRPAAKRASGRRPTKAMLANSEKYAMTPAEKIETIRMGVVAVIKGYSVARAIIGSTGVGKSHVVREELEHFEMPYSVVTGGIKNHHALYEFLHANNDPERVVVFDDCNDVLRNKKCVEILRKAVDLDCKREITLLDTNKGVDGSGTPKKFEFLSRVIIVTNLPKRKLDEAIVSRTSPVEAWLTPAEVFGVVKVAAHDAQPVSAPTRAKTDVLNFIEREVGLDGLKRFCFRQFRDCVIWRLASENYDGDRELWKRQVYNALY